MSGKERQSGIKYMLTQRDINRRLADQGVLVRCPIRIGDLGGIPGMDRARFLEELAPSFERLAWDDNDVKRAQVKFLATHFPGMNKRLAEFSKRYYRGECGLDEVEDLLEELDFWETMKFEEIRSYRRRSIARFRIVNRGTGNWHNQWQIHQLEAGAFEQDVDDDERAAPRVFDPTANEVLQHPEFIRLLYALAEMVEDCEEGQETEIVELEVVFHQMGLVAPRGATPSNAPEGRHKDGADYIMSALVVERSEFLIGGVSEITDWEGRTLVHWQLEPGQYIFQADQSSTLYHDVSEIQINEEALAEAGACIEAGDGHEGDEEGVRNIFGFDVKVKRRLKDA